MGLGYACIGVPFSCVLCHDLFADGQSVSMQGMRVRFLYPLT